MNNDNNLILKLYKRGLIAAITNENALIKILQSKSIKLYCGFDPTADSLHVGHLVPLLCLRQFQISGHHPIILLGGATGLIGDPSFKDSERKLQFIDTIYKWIEKIKYQISLFIDCSNNCNTKANIINNYDWFSSMSLLTFLRDIGKFFSINKMIHKDAITNRIKNNHRGISYAEFSYNLLQSYDFAYLYKNYNVILQIGGSDQWGNIISGIELIHRIYKKTTYGLTMPLITKSDDIKFGKTEKNTIWLDPNKTSPYKFYQHWINSSDKEVYRFLRFFTSIDIAKINLLKKENNINNTIPKAQIILAEEITKLVHGQQGLKIAQRITKNLFTKGKILKLTEHDLMQLTKDGIPTITINKNITSLQHILVKSKLAPSLTKARELISSNSITINTHKQSQVKYTIHNTDKLYNRFTLLKRGKKNYCLIQWEE